MVYLIEFLVLGLVDLVLWVAYFVDFRVFYSAFFVKHLIINILVEDIAGVAHKHGPVPILNAGIAVLFSSITVELVLVDLHDLVIILHSQLLELHVDLGLLPPHVPDVPIKQNYQIGHFVGKFGEVWEHELAFGGCKRLNRQSIRLLLLIIRLQLHNLIIVKLGQQTRIQRNLVELAVVAGADGVHGHLG